MGLLALACVALQFGGQLWLSAVALGAWLVGLALFCRPALRRLWMPRFWLISLLFAVGSGLLLGRRDLQLWGLELSSAGLCAGLLMVARGALIFGLACWASLALAERDIQRAARRLGAAWLGTALPTALKLLPELVQQYHLAAAQAPGRRLARGYEVAVLLVCHTARLARQMARRADLEQRGPGVLKVALVGTVGSGKTSAAQRLCESLERQGLRLGGVLQPRRMEQQQCRGYLLQDVASGAQRPFARRRGARDGSGLGYDFDEQGWQWAAERITEARRRADVVLVDELGRLEARGQGHLPALQGALDEERATVWLLCVRADRADQLEQRLGPFGLRWEVDSGEDLVEDLACEITAHAR